MIDVIGTDAGAPASLPTIQQQLIHEANWIAAPRRLQPALKSWLNRPTPFIDSDDPRVLVEALQGLDATASVVVLASGDPLWFGIGRILGDRLGAERLRFHPAPTSLQLAFARIGRSWQDASWVSLHGREPQALSKALQQRPSALAVLTDPNQGGAKSVRQILAGSGLEASYELWLCENLGHSQERILQISPEDDLPVDLQRLLIALLIEKEPTQQDPKTLPIFGLDDGVYLQHIDHPGLMTKREVRIQLLADLNPPERGVLWDLGAGTGSVGLEALRLRPELQLMAVEQRAGGAALIKANAERLGVSPAAVIEANAIDLVRGELPAGLEKPNRVLVGGGGRQRNTLLQLVLERLHPDGVVVVPLATLESLSDVRLILEGANMRVRVSQLQAWRGQPLSDGTRLVPMNPILTITGSISYQK
jgi:precorrin-6Y C5,15-methyltransferase (decarboxylating)